MFSLLIIMQWYLLTRYKKYYFSDRKKLEKWQNKKAKEILAFARKKSRFYHELYSNISVNNFENLPIIDKAIFMKNFNTINTVGIDFKLAYDVAIKAEESRDFTPEIGGIVVGLSSGTSGNRGLFLVSKKERLSWAGAILAKMLPNGLFHKQRIAFFLRANSNIYTTLKRQFIQFEFYDLLHTIESHIKSLNKFQPSIVVAPPSMLRLLAEARKQNQLLIKPIKIISVAEVLEPLDKEYIEKIFQQKVQQIYQATEGFLATTCEYGTLHLNEDSLLIEKKYIDLKKKKFIPIITDLYRGTQPIIRYELNDILSELKTPCPCGSVYTALEQIDGRCDDLFYVKCLENNTLIPLFPDFIRRVIVTSSPYIKEYKVTQFSPFEIEISLSCSENALEAQNKIRENIAKLFDKIAAVCPAIHFQEYEHPEKGVKLRRLVRKFSINENTFL